MIALPQRWPAGDRIQARLGVSAQQVALNPDEDFANAGEGAEHEAYVQRNARSLELDLRKTIMFIVTIVLVVVMALVWRVL